MNKTISINPDLFKLSSDKKTRKTSSKSNINDIKVRPPPKDKRKQQNVRRNHVLRFIREQQEKNYKRLTQGDDSSKPTSAHTHTDEFDSDFDVSLKYLSTLDETKPSTYSTNHTLRNRVSTNENVSLNFPQEAMDLPMIETIHPPNTTPPMKLHPIMKPPQWGCLKHGELPTYRNWKNVTQRAHEIREVAKQAVPVNKPRMYYPKQKRTVKRHFIVGKCKTKPVVGVLVSNRTLRNDTTTKAQLMKQTSIQDVRRYLVKKGFIKVGSIAPNDILRQMYETACLMCGEIENHNPENLMYNYFHDTNK